MHGSRVLFLYPGTARRDRLADARAGLAPREFFYGLPGLAERGYDVAIGDTHARPPTATGRTFMAFEIARNRAARVGWSRARVAAIRERFDDADIALSFTDSFSLAMGLSANSLPAGTLRVGGFMRLSDLAAAARPVLRGHVERTIARALAGLDHLFFFGAEDREEVIRRYGIDPARASSFDFGVDTAFWTPAERDADAEGVLAVGSDPSRDYATLLSARTKMPTCILTRLPIALPAGSPDVQILRGSLHAAAVTDDELRTMYRAAAIVAVPLNDVWQPTGQSVTMQAMACGRPVILTRGRGLWDRDVFRHGENCLLVPPGDPDAWTAALSELADDPTARERIGSAARETAVRHFDIARMDDSIERLVRTVAGG
jgi:hypothetical protein